VREILPSCACVCEGECTGKHLHQPAVAVEGARGRPRHQHRPRGANWRCPRYCRQRWQKVPNACPADSDAAGGARGWEGDVGRRPWIGVGAGGGKGDWEPDVAARAMCWGGPGGWGGVSKRAELLSRVKLGIMRVMIKKKFNTFSSICMSYILHVLYSIHVLYIFCVQYMYDTYLVRGCLAARSSRI
jgi:hypothetical protein